MRSYKKGSYKKSSKRLRGGYQNENMNPDLPNWQNQYIQLLDFVKSETGEAMANIVDRNIENERTWVPLVLSAFIVLNQKLRAAQTRAAQFEQDAFDQAVPIELPFRRDSYFGRY